MSLAGAWVLDAHGGDAGRPLPLPLEPPWSSWKSMCCSNRCNIWWAHMPPSTCMIMAGMLSGWRLRSDATVTLQLRDPPRPARGRAHVLRLPCMCRGAACACTVCAAVPLGPAMHALSHSMWFPHAPWRSLRHALHHSHDQHGPIYRTPAARHPTSGICFNRRVPAPGSVLPPTLVRPLPTHLPGRPLVRNGSTLCSCRASGPPPT